jgi:predicted  nucleic acid-binding Zn-ribbon protein
MLRDAIKVILEVQERDVQMIRLMRLKREREDELDRIHTLLANLHNQMLAKEHEVIDSKKQCKLNEVEIAEITAKIEKLEKQQNSVKKVEEFNAFRSEITALERQKTAKEQMLSDLYDQQAQEDDLLKNLKATYQTTKENSHHLEQEIIASVEEINKEGSQIQQLRQELSLGADPEILAVYEKLLKNKKDQVVVPIENRCCSGCHILVTAQHENLVRKGEKLVFCEHCSRIHYWQESLVPQEEEKAMRRRRRPIKG